MVVINQRMILLSSNYAVNSITSFKNRRLGDDVGYIKDKEIEYIRARDMIVQYLKKIILSTILKSESYVDVPIEKQSII